MSTIGAPAAANLRPKRAGVRHRTQAAAAQCRALWRAAGPAPQGLRHLADVDLGPAARRGAPVRRRPAQARHRARRRGGHHRRQPAEAVRHLRGRAERGRHRRADLPGLGGGRDGLRARAFRGEVRRRPEPGAGRQGDLGGRPAAEAQAGHLRRAARAGALRSGQACIPSSMCRAWGARSCAATPGPPAGGWTRSPGARARTSA